jgi:hypothetical protein
MMAKRGSKTEKVIVLQPPETDFSDIAPESSQEPEVSEAVPEVENADKSVQEVKIVQPSVRAAYEYVTPKQNLRDVFIGGTYYNLSANVKVKLPADVVRIFRERDLIREL